MSGCDQTCWWCANHFWKYVKGRMLSAEAEGGRSGEGSFADAAATSVSKFTERKGNGIEMKIWVTKYALTRGIFPMQAEIIDDKYAHGKHDGFPVFTPEWQPTEEEALAAGEAMRKAKIALLETQIAKLKKLKIKST